MSKDVRLLLFVSAVSFTGMALTLLVQFAS